MIGDDIEVVIYGIEGRKVRIGVDAPLMVVVHRKEVYEKIRAEAVGKRDDLGSLGKGAARIVRRVFSKRKKP